VVEAYWLFFSAEGIGDKLSNDVIWCVRWFVLFSIALAKSARASSTGVSCHLMIRRIDFRWMPVIAEFPSALGLEYASSVIFCFVKDAKIVFGYESTTLSFKFVLTIVAKSS
jgi:hypothetical protein